MPMWNTPPCTQNNLFWYYFLIKLFNLIKKAPPNGVVVFMIFEIENHENPSHYDLHIKNFNSYELKFLIEYQYHPSDKCVRPLRRAHLLFRPALPPIPICGII